MFRLQTSMRWQANLPGFRKLPAMSTHKCLGQASHIRITIFCDLHLNLIVSGIWDLSDCVASAVTFVICPVIVSWIEFYKIACQFHQVFSSLQGVSGIINRKIIRYHFFRFFIFLHEVFSSGKLWIYGIHVFDQLIFHIYPFGFRDTDTGQFRYLVADHSGHTHITYRLYFSGIFFIIPWPVLFIFFEYAFYFGPVSPGTQHFAEQADTVQRISYAERFMSTGKEKFCRSIIIHI